MSRQKIRFALAVVGSALVAVPAHAADSVALPEPGSLTLLGLGVAGVLIGRTIARKPPQG